jgi:hypothetical protein
MDSDSVQQAIDTLARKYGLVSCAHEGADTRLLIALEDDPNDAGARRRLSSVLTGLVNGEVVELVGIEGAFGEVDTSWLAQLPDTDLRQAMCEHMMDELTLSPAEFCHVFTRTPFVLLGLEDKDAFREATRLWSELAPFKDYLDAYGIGRPTGEDLANAPAHLRDLYPEVTEYARVLRRRVDEMLSTLVGRMDVMGLDTAAVVASGTPLDLLLENAAERGISYLRVKPPASAAVNAQYGRLLEAKPDEEYWEA